MGLPFVHLPFPSLAIPPQKAWSLAEGVRRVPSRKMSAEVSVRNRPSLETCSHSCHTHGQPACCRRSRAVDGDEISLSPSVAESSLAELTWWWSPWAPATLTQLERNAVQKRSEVA